MSIYYIDFFGGNDSLDGLSPQYARKTQESLILNAGDSVLFKRGTAFYAIACFNVFTVYSVIITRVPIIKALFVI